MSRHADSRIDQKNATVAEAGVPLFLQRKTASSFLSPPSLQNQPDEENLVMDAQETGDAVDFAPIAFDPGQEIDTSENSVEIPRDKKYSDQFRQLEVLIEERSHTRAITRWAMNFFQGNPSIENVARSLTKKVDYALFAINRAEGFPLAWLDATSWFGIFRIPIDAAVELYLERSRIPWLITYRIPRPVAVAMIAVEDVRGKCEEHAFLTVYLLTIGHMIQEMPYGQLIGDIYYTGAATAKHGFAILVKGDEFKEAIKASIEKTGKIDARWLCKHTDLWGANAWIVDGWSGEAKKLSDNPVSLSYIMTQGFRRNPTTSLTSEWDLTVYQMALRVAQAYGIQ